MWSYMEPITALLHQFENPHDNGDAVVPPIVSSTYYVMKSYEQLEQEYGREGGDLSFPADNPVVSMLEQKLAVFEKGEGCKCFASGMAALSGTIMAFVQPGDHLICPQSAALTTNSFFSDYLPRFGISVTFVDGSIEAIEREIRPNTVLIYLESPSPYLYRMQDLRRIAELGVQQSILTIVNNTLATPVFQNPIELGIDLVIHSLGEYMSGHSDVLGGAVIGSAAHIKRIVERGADIHGAVLAAPQAWFVLRGLRTMGVRMRRHHQSAMAVAQLLEKHPRIEKVYYPSAEGYEYKELAENSLKGYPGIISIVLKGTGEQVRAFVNRLRLFRIGHGWGGYNSAVLPVDAVLAAGGSISVNDGNSPDRLVPERLVRLSVGLEDAVDLQGDLLQALEQAGHEREVRNHE